MATHTSQKVEFINLKKLVDNIGQKFSIDPYHSDWRGKGTIQIRCPNCSVKKFHAHYHLGLNFSKNAYNCFRCPFHGRLTDFLKSSGIRYETKTQISVPIENINAPKIKLPIDFEKDEETYEKAREYLIRRGFSLNFLLKNFKMWPITNIRHYYFGYLIIPLNDYAFYARKFLKLSDLQQKHIIKKSDKNMHLYYTYEKNNSKTLLVVESMFNLMRAAQYGYDAVCIFGKNHWAGFLEYIKNYGVSKTICLCFDSDVKIKDIEMFVKKVRKKHKLEKLFYIDPKDMPFNDIAMIQDKETLINLINKKKSIENMFIDIISL